MDIQTLNLQAVAMELHYEITLLLYKEARMLDNEMVREWLSEFVSPNICYQMVMTEERFRKDKSSAEAREVMPYDDNMAALELRVRQFETGLQSMMDPPQRMRRLITNVEVFHGDRQNEFRVFSYGMVLRFRRQYEREQLVFDREDILIRGEDGAFRLEKRRINLAERVIRNKNLLFFL